MNRFFPLLLLFLSLFSVPKTAAQSNPGDPGPITGSQEFCPGPTYTYSIAPVLGAQAYLWTAPPGSLINAGPGSSATIPAPGGTTVTIQFGSAAGEVCVRVIGATHSDTSATSCLQVKPFFVAPTVLPPVVINLGDCLDFFGQQACATGVYQTVFQSALGCDSVVQQEIIVRSCTYDVEIGGLPLPCGATSAQLTCLASPAPATCTWYLPDGSTVVGPTLTTTLVGEYTIYATSPTGCPVTRKFKIAFNGTPAVADAGPDKLLGCAPSSTATLAATASGGPNMTFSWSGPGINAGNANTLNPAVAQIGTYILSVVNPDNGCTDQDTVAVLPDQWPSASAGPDVTISCPTGTVTLDGSASTTGANFSFQWQGPDIHAGNSAALSPAVTSEGMYILTVQNTAQNCTDRDTVVVAAAPNLPIADAGADTMLICKSPSVRIGGVATNSGPGFTILWSGLGLLPGEAAKKRPLVNAAGTYTLTVTRTSDGCQRIDRVAVGPIEYPTADAGSDLALTCANAAAVQLSADGSIIPSGGVYKARWSGPGIDAANENSKYPTVFLPGTYTVTVTDNPTGCTDTDEVVVTRDAAVPIANAGPDRTQTTVGQTVTLDGTGSSAGGAPFQYIWSGPGITNANRNSAQPSVSVPGNYILKIRNLNTNCTARDRAIVSESIILLANSDRARQPFAATETALWAAVLPNPVERGGQAILQIENAVEGQLEVSVFDLSGRRLVQEWFSADGGASAQFALPPLNAAGHFVLKIVAADGQATHAKLVVR